MPILVTAVGSLYVVANIVELFIIAGRLSLLNGFKADVAAGRDVPADAFDQITASADHVNTGADVTGFLYIVALICIMIWVRRLNTELGFVGVRRAVLKRAGYNYFQASWLLSLVLGFYVSTQTQKVTSATTLQDLIDHDHLLTAFYGVRVLLGAAMVVFAVRLERISDEGFARVDFSRAGRAGADADAFAPDAR